MDKEEYDALIICRINNVLAPTSITSKSEVNTILNPLPIDVFLIQGTIEIDVDPFVKWLSLYHLVDK